mgnify:CR=1 FL=1
MTSQPRSSHVPLCLLLLLLARAVSDVFVKLSSPPLLLQLDLLHPVVPSRSRAVVVPGGVELHLRKATTTATTGADAAWSALQLPAATPAQARL